MGTTMGAGKPTINDVARIAGVSKKTVSRVINKSPLLSEKTRSHVEAVIADIGYVPNPQARALALRRNFIIAVIHDNPNAQFVVSVQKGVLDGIKGTEFGLMVQPVDRNSPTIVDDVRQFLERQRPYGVVLLPPVSENDGLAQMCEDFGCRYVRMASVEIDDPRHLVMSNDRAACREAVQYLIDQGHHKIALIEGPSGFRSALERRGGYEMAMENAGIEIEPWMIAQGQYTFESGVNAGGRLLDGDSKPTAIFGSNDVMAMGAVVAARKRGIDVPSELSVVGFDDTPQSAQIWPALTTVRWPIAEMANLAARKLIAQTDDDMPTDDLLPSMLIKRDSVVKPNG